MSSRRARSRVASRLPSQRERSSETEVSSCEVGEPEAREARSLLRFDPGSFTWEGVPVRAYKPDQTSALVWEGVTRQTLIGAASEPVAFEVRYFEVAPGGFSCYEAHQHAHAVIVVRGRGRIRVGDEVLDVRPLDVVYVAPDVPHQFLNDDEGEPFGFICSVDAVRDAPRPP